MYYQVPESVTFLHPSWGRFTREATDVGHCEMTKTTKASMRLASLPLRKSLSFSEQPIGYR
jgi:hypothetical protein